MRRSALAGHLLLLLAAQGCAAAQKVQTADAGADSCDGSADCYWECPADVEIDLCGECGGENLAKDCHGVCYGLAEVDECGFCTEVPVPDCHPPVVLAALQAGSEDHFGESVSLDGDSALIGAVYDGEGGERSGAAYVFVRDLDGWLLQQKLVADDAKAGDNFGYAVAISGDTALVGAYSDDDHGGNRGSAYFFERQADEWEQRIELAPPPEPAGVLYFGIAVALDGDTALIGARRYRSDVAIEGIDCYTGTAFAYLREATGWRLQGVLESADGTDCDRFGDKVAIDGDTAVVGAPAYWAYPETGAVDPSAYVFARQGEQWNAQARLLPDPGVVGVKFGSSVAIDGETLIVGAHLEEQTERYQGSAYVFARDGEAWSLQSRLRPSDPAAGSFFGFAVDLNGEVAVVGAPFGNPAQGARSGAAYVFVRNGTEWTERAKLMDLVRAEYDWYGWNVAAGFDEVLVGAEPSGAAQIHRLPPAVTAGAVPAR